MQITKWGNPFAAVHPIKLIRRLELKKCNKITLYADGTEFSLAQRTRPEDVLKSLRQFRGRLSGKIRLSRDEANAR
ncbi:MAG: AbrB/MazE/SpoVT family DNA-binding domain-containing protein [Rhodobacteraceae bacterium]|nr:AbrB/MazE/SpoVT family DNA-binding domain-containing protein [Paracoccaceae bacterium]